MNIRVDILKALEINRYAQRDRPVVFLVLAVPLLLLQGCGKYIYTQIDIEAPRGKVWEVLADIDNYAEWNPYHVEVNGVLEEHEKLQVKISKPNGKNLTIEPIVLNILPEQELIWGGGIKGIFFGEHNFQLEELENQSTRLVHKESFTGIAVPFASLDAIEEGYNLVNLRLKEKVEAQSRTSKSD